VILVVEDEWIIRDQIAQELRGAGWQVLESHTAEAAIDYLRARREIRVLFTDIQLAGQMSGWDVAEEFRTIRPEAAVIYASGNTQDRSRRVAGSLFFDKPYVMADVVETCCGFV